MEEDEERICDEIRCKYNYTHNCIHVIILPVFCIVSKLKYLYYISTDNESLSIENKCNSMRLLFFESFDWNPVHLGLSDFLCKWMYFY